MKKIKLINQNKGGQGKTFLTSLIIAKENQDNSNFVAVDADSGNRSLIKRFEGTPMADKVIEFSLFNDKESETIDKTLFEELFNNIADGDYENIYIDLGGNESRELLKFFELIGVESIKEYFKEMDFGVEFFTIISVGDRDCIDHLNKVQKSLKNVFTNVIFINEGFINPRLDTDKIELITKYAKDNKIELRYFGKAEGSLKDKMSDYVRSGFTAPIGMFKGHFNKLIEQVNI
jgi:cellulose biosynthesis protein BcsQ